MNDKVYLYHYKDCDYGHGYFILTNTYAKPLLDDIEKHFDFDRDTFIDNIGNNNKILKEYLETHDADLENTYTFTVELLKFLGWWVDYSEETIYY
jgi:hypothetical protein